MIKVILDGINSTKQRHKFKILIYTQDTMDQFFLENSIIEIVFALHNIM